MNSLNLTPLPAVASQHDALSEHIERWADELVTSDFRDQVLDETMNRVMTEAFLFSHANEGSIWIADRKEENLVGVFNTGPEPEVIIGQSQPLGRGIISLVYASEQAYCENEVGSSSAHDSAIDERVGKRTGALMAVPFYYADRLRGVVSCVQFESGAGFSPDDVGALQLAVTLLERLISERLLRAAIGG